MPTSIDHTGGRIRLEPAGEGRRRVTVQLRDPNLYVRLTSCETSYSDDLIQRILDVKGIDYLCDEIGRDEDPNYLERTLLLDILAYLPEAAFDGKTILDFGCGCGASTMIMARTFPRARIVGVELLPEHVAIAEQRATHHGAKNVRFLTSPDGESLPEGIGSFDFVIMSAVYEHLLPSERRTLLPLLWSHLVPGGILFLDQTPNRYFPIEVHTTDLAFLNYLPAKLALHAARKFSPRVRVDEDWPTLLRRGIRGGTAREIMRILARTPHQPKLLEPSRLGVNGRIDLWYKLSASSRLAWIKKGVAMSLRALQKTTGATLTPYLALALQKSPTSKAA